MNPRVTNWVYWGTTGLFAFGMTGSGLAALTGATAEAMVHLGYPAYFSTILGVWKLLGVVAVLAPGLPRLKEWAYAGFVFNLTGAAASHLAVGDGIGGVVVPAVLLTLMAASWALRPAGRRLGTLPGLATEGRAAVA